MGSQLSATPCPIAPARIEHPTGRTTTLKERLLNGEEIAPHSSYKGQLFIACRLARSLLGSITCPHIISPTESIY